jgi:hypothetical protein
VIRKILLISVFALALACAKNKNSGVVYQVPSELQPFIDSFIKEAANRGHVITITNLIIKYDTTSEDSLCGSCNSLALNTSVQKIITITPNQQCWDNNTELETLIFHELGHCILGRQHTTALLPNGDPKSIMTPHNLTLYSPCIYAIGGGPCDNSFKRPYYLDELFNPNTPVPAWGE